ncbi:MAG: hypothetical protein HC799_02645 [Limnothrix sp. RL_2_0]|nr:hypothetical protein [Limnothrix sp. RL_2_0]
MKLEQEKLKESCLKHHIRRLALFGSVLRDDFTLNSDVNVLVEFESGYTLRWEIVTLLMLLMQIMLLISKLEL